MRADTIILGAGHAGLAMSLCLKECSVEHVILERGSVANSWRTERWDSLRLLTPNWQSRLPGCVYETTDPDGFMTMPEVVGFIEGYAEVISAPVENHTTVTSVRRTDNGYDVSTNRGAWQCRCLVIATGACNIPTLPSFADALPPSVVSVTPMEYSGPHELPSGGVLVVGASATGVQLALEIHRSGRPVTIAVGEHIRMPRVYRGKDVQWWLDVSGFLDERFDAVDDLVRARNVPSPQLIGSPERSTVNLNVLGAMGVNVVGRFAGLRGSIAQFSGSLHNTCKLADLKMNRLLDRLDEWATKNDYDGSVEKTQRFQPTRVESNPPLSIDLESGEIRTVLWATGYRPDYSWLHVPVIDGKGRVRHKGGIVDSPGMYLMGANFMRRRKSSFIHGAGDDAHELSAHLASYLERR